MGDQLAYSVDEVCAKSGLGRTTIYAAIGDGSLIARKFRRRTVVLHDDLNNFLENLPPIGGSAPRAVLDTCERPECDRQSLNPVTHRGEGRATLAVVAPNKKQSKQ